jgi:hypothetical protein
MTFGMTAAATGEGASAEITETRHRLRPDL